MDSSLFLFIDNIPSSEYMFSCWSTFWLFLVWGCGDSCHCYGSWRVSAYAFTCKPVRYIPRRRVTTSPWFAQEFRGFSTESPTSQETNPCPTQAGMVGHTASECNCWVSGYKLLSTPLGHTKLFSKVVVLIFIANCSLWDSISSPTWYGPPLRCCHHDGCGVVAHYGFTLHFHGN